MTTKSRVLYMLEVAAALILHIAVRPASQGVLPGIVSYSATLIFIATAFIGIKDDKSFTQLPKLLRVLNGTAAILIATYIAIVAFTAAAFNNFTF